MAPLQANKNLVYMTEMMVGCSAHVSKQRHPAGQFVIHFDCVPGGGAVTTNMAAVCGLGSNLCDILVNIW